MPSSVLEQPVQYLKGVGPQRAKALSELGVRTLRELLLFLPRSYIDRSTSTTLRALARALHQQEQLFHSPLALGDSERLLYSEVTLIARAYLRFRAADAASQHQRR
jgi:RecG-like helicase